MELRGLVGDDDRLVGSAGALPLPLLAERTVLRTGLSTAMTRRGFTPVYDRGQLLVDLAVTSILGGDAISDFQGLRHLALVIGPIPSTPTVWRAMAEVGERQTVPDQRGGDRVPAALVGTAGRPPRRVPWLRVAGRELARGTRWSIWTPRSCSPRRDKSAPRACFQPCTTGQIITEAGDAVDAYPQSGLRHILHRPRLDSAASMVVGSIPRMGKTFAVRLLLLAAALDVRAELHLFELKGTGDFGPLEPVAHAYRAGDEEDDIEYAVADMRALQTEVRRRTKVIRELPRAVCPESKVTGELADKRSLGLWPIVVTADECQRWFEHKRHGEELTSSAEDLVRRGPAAGIIPIFATQRPDAKSLPTGISGNAILRFCLKVMGHTENDMVLGTSCAQERDPGHDLLAQGPRYRLPVRRR